MAAPPTLLCTSNFAANAGFAWDFIERMYARIADVLSPRGVRTIVGYPELSAPPRSLEGSTAIPLQIDTTLASARARAELRSFIREENVRVLYLSDRPAWSVWYPFIRAAGLRKIIVHDHTSGSRTAPSGIRAALKSAIVRIPGVAADVVIAVSDFVAERDRRTSLLPRERIRRIWNGLDVSDDRVDAQRPDVRAQLGLPADAAVIGCACRATSEKGVDVLFRAFDRLSAQTENSPALIYIGNGPALESLSALRDSLPSRARIHMMGYASNAASLLRTANVCVTPSIWEEAFSLAVLEMMLRGRVVIASRVGGIPELIEDGVTGFLVPPSDVDSLAEGLRRVIGNPTMQSSVGVAALKRAQQLFSADRQVTDVVATFDDAFVTGEKNV